MEKIYPDSKVEIQGFAARKYDQIMNIMSLGLYDKFIRSVVANLNIQPTDHIIDLGCGTGRNACLMRQYLDETGSILGLDISEEMGKQFRQNCLQFKNVSFRNLRIDTPFLLEQKHDKAFISFVLHGFPQDTRLQIVENAYQNLKNEGKFCILDFSEFSLKEMPFYFSIPFKTIECKYAFDFIERDWKQILGEQGFGNFEESFMFKKYIRLLIAQKL
ncbi:MAG: class I SAM-dependent methyltransferase [Proteobacteria bacterium]|nr:class I SAM-dependent methyltransferase [Pseudomonadota bacterium]